VDVHVHLHVHVHVHIHIITTTINNTLLGIQELTFYLLFSGLEENYWWSKKGPDCSACAKVLTVLGDLWFVTAPSQLSGVLCLFVCYQNPFLERFYLQLIYDTNRNFEASGPAIYLNNELTVSREWRTSHWS
jgi:hypothetical protein